MRAEMLDLSRLVSFPLAKYYRGNILETTGSETHDNKTNGEGGKSTASVLDDGRESGDDQDYVPDERAGNRVHDGVESTPVLISEIGTEQGSNVGPERVD